MIAWPVATLANGAEHSGHFAWTFLHMLGGTGMLFLGGANLYLAGTRRNFPLHRRIGQSYLALGILGSLTAIVITLSTAHKNPGGPVLTSSTISLVTLALAWLAFAAMGWRAARNRRFDSHRDWMIRAYVLVWSFVSCRIVSRTTSLEEIGGGEAFIWLSWVAPLLIAEVALQWRLGGPPQRTTNAVDAAAQTDIA